MSTESPTDTTTAYDVVLEDRLFHFPEDEDVASTIFSVTSSNRFLGAGVTS